MTDPVPARLSDKSGLLRKAALAVVVILAGILALELGLEAIDATLKRVSRPGFAPADATVWYTPSFRAWEGGLARVTGGPELAAALTPRVYELRQRLSTLTGLPSDARVWEAFFGRYLILAELGEEWVVCVRPGLHGRLLLRTRGLYGAVAVEDLFPARAWREGFLLGGTRAAVEAAQAAPSLEEQLRDGAYADVRRTQALALFPFARANHRAEARLTARPGLHAAIRLPDPPALSEAPLATMDPEGIALACASPREGRALIQWLLTALPDDWQPSPRTRTGPTVAQAFDLWSEKLPALHHDAQPAPAALFVLRDLRFVEDYLVATWGERWTWSHRAAPAFPAAPDDAPAFPMAWNRARGWSAPLFGPLVGLHGAGTDAAWCFASAEPLMPSLSSAALDSPINTHVLLNGNGAVLAGALSEMAAHPDSAGLEASDWNRWARVLSFLNRIQLRGQRVVSDGGHAWLAFEGDLTRTEDVSR